MEYIPTIFYILGIIYFIVWIALMILIGVLSWKAYQYIRRAPKEIQEQIEAKVKNMLPSGDKVVGIVGTVAMPFILNRLKNFFRRR